MRVQYENLFKRLCNEAGMSPPENVCLMSDNLLLREINLLLSFFHCTPLTIEELKQKL